MTSLNMVLVAALGVCVSTSSAWADATAYPLTLENCGETITFEKAPERAVTLGQEATEILYSLGLGDSVKGTSLWTNEVDPRFEEINAKVERLATTDPSFEAVVGKRPDLVAVQWEYSVREGGPAGTREQFGELGIPTYILPVDCLNKDNSIGSDGTRTAALNTETIARGVRELAMIFDVQDAGEAVVAQIQAAEAEAVAIAEKARSEGVSAVFWYSSSDKGIDPFVAGSKGAPGFMMDKLGIRNIVETNEEWPVVGWETIARQNPTIIVVAHLDREKYAVDDVAKKIAFLKSDPVTSKLDAVRNDRIVTMQAHAMDATLAMFGGLRTLADAMNKLD